MKRVALLVAAVAATTATAKAAEDVEFKQSGEFRVRYFNDINATGQEASGQKADTTGRFKYNVSARKGESLQAYASFLHNAQFGAQRSFSGEYADALLVSRAWGWWKASDSLSFKVGRFGIEIADGAVFAENDWEDVPVAHEGLQLAWDFDFAKLNAFAVKTHDNNKTGAATNAGDPSSDPERNFYMLSLDIKNLPEAIKMANVHFIQMNQDQYATGAAPTGLQAGYMNAQHVGFTVGGDVSNIMYKGTAAFQFGTFNKDDRTTPATDQKLSANMFDLMVGYSMPETLGLKVSAGFHQDSGAEAGSDMKQYQPMYYDKHNYAGLMDVVRWGNLTYWNLNASVLPVEDLEVGAGFYMFSRTKDSGTTTLGERYSGISTATGSVAEGEKDLGSEVDVYANKSYDNNLKIGARFGAFMPGTYLKDGEVKVDKTLMQAMLQASLEF